MDLRPLFEQWPHHPSDDDRNVRCVRGEDGRLVIQVRARCGIFQWEYEGRPDGRRPRGFTSLLDYYRHRIEEVRCRSGVGTSLQLDEDEVAEVGEELLDYYQRRVLFFRLGEYERARRDADHNLALMDLVAQHCEDTDLILEHEKWRPFVTMDRARADALLAFQSGAYQDGLRKLDKGIDDITAFYHRHSRPDLVPLSQEIAALKDLKTQLRESYDVPLSREEVIAGLREEQEKAIADEDYERAARIRDEIDRYQGGPPSASA
ncbi:MAG: UvrB/UvrC motif-containing protein [Planctomycetota bacterium]